MVSGGRTNTWLGMLSPPVPIMTSQRADFWDKHVHTNGADKDVFFCLIYLSPKRHTLLLVTAGKANTGLLIALVHKYQVSAGKNLTPCAK